MNRSSNSKVNIRKSKIRRKDSSCCCYSLNKNSQKGYIPKRNFDTFISGIIPGNGNNKALNIDLSSGKMNIKGLKINTNINGIVSDRDNFKGDKINISDINLRKSVLNKSIEGNICNKNDIKDSNNQETEEKIDGDINFSKNKLEPNNDYENKYEFNMSIDQEIKSNNNDIKINSLKNSSEDDSKSKNKNNSSNKNIFSSKIRDKKSEDILPKEVINFINPEMPPNLPNIKINAPKKEDSFNNYLYHEETHNLPNINNNHLGRESLNKELYSNINPEGPNSEIYKKNILLGQKILIVMLYNDISVNINKLFYNEENKTVKDAVSHFGIEIITVNNYLDAIKELTKDENGKCPYYACWLLNSSSITPETNQFLDILVKFWKNGGAVVLFSDNTPFIEETNLFLLKINANFIMEGNYIGQKDIYGDDTGLLNNLLYLIETRVAINIKLSKDKVYAIIYIVYMKELLLVRFQKIIKEK